MSSIKQYIYLICEGTSTNDIIKSVNSCIPKKTTSFFNFFKSSNEIEYEEVEKVEESEEVEEVEESEESEELEEVEVEELEDNKYNKGKIYKLVCDDGHYYIGSTTQKLYLRLL